MATCTYSFQTAQGPITIRGQAEFKAYLASQGVESILPATLASNRRAPIFYSPLARAVQEAKMDSMPGKQWGAWLLSNAGKLGIKKDEIQWTGITDWLELQTGKVSKADIQAYLDSNGVQVTETMLGEGGTPRLPDGWEVERQPNGEYYLLDQDGEVISEGETERQAIENGMDMDELADNPDAAGDTKYSKYTVPGGENYKELLLTLPVPSDYMTVDDQKKRLMEEYGTDNWFDLTDEQKESLRLKDEKRQRTPVYKSNHFVQPNILAHVRFDERTDADGKRVLFLNEIQSDWGQEGKKKGFNTNPKDKARHDELRRKWLNNTLTIEEGNEFDRLSEQGAGRIGEIATAPFVTETKSWVSLSIKRMLRYAVDNGFDKVAFINGQQAADLYDLSKSISRVTYQDASSSGVGPARMTDPEDFGTLKAYGLDNKPVIDKTVSHTELPDLIGKEAADKLLSAKPEQRSAFGLNVRHREISGLDLQVGGEGMRVFYDQIVPQVANDVLKKLGGGKAALPVREPLTARVLTRADVEVSELSEGLNSGSKIVTLKGDDTALLNRSFRSDLLEARGVSDDDLKDMVLDAVNKQEADRVARLNAAPADSLSENIQITITPEMAAKISSGLPLFSNRRKPGSGSKFALPEESVYDARVRTWQNDQVRWKRQMAAIKARGGVVNEQNNVYQAMERMIARAMNRTEDFYAKTVTPILKEMKDASITIDDLGQYLYARHAKERNAYIAEINPAFANTAYDEVGGSGMSDQEADEIIARVQADPQAADYDRFAEAFRGWAEANLDGLVQGGLLSQEQADSMRERFPNYVPLRGFEAEDDEAGIFGQGAGFSTGKRLFQRTLGRRTKADNPASYIIHQVAEGMLAREKANVGRYLERLVADNPDDKLWTIGEPDKEPVMGYAPLRYKLMLNGKEVDTFNTKTQAQQYKQLMNLKGATIEETGGEPQVMQRDLGYDPEKEVRFIRDGKQVRIQLKDPLLARAYNNGGAAEMGVLLQASASINAFLREMWTQKNPVFPLVNMLRDVPSAMLYAAGEMPGLATSMPKYLPGAWKAMYAQAKGEKIEGEWGPWVTEYRKAGGGIGFRMVGDIQSTMDRINRIEKKLGRESVLEALQAGNLKDATKRILWRTYNNAVTDFIERINQAFENMSRLAIYRASREQGASVAEASRMAKNATVNFNRRGEMTNNINSLYLFANAAIQDLAKNKRSVMDAPGKAKVGAALAGVATLGMMLGFFADDDDDLIDENMNVNAIRLTVGDKTVSLPLSYGLIGFAHYLGRSIAKVAKGEDIGMQSLRLASALLTNALPINPIPNPDKVDVANTVIGVAPTAIEFPLQVALNRNAFGSMMMPDYNNDPDAYKTFRGTRGTIYADVAAFLNESTGGDKRQSGWIDISPETLKGIVHFTLGGTGKFVADSFTSATNLLGGSSAKQNSVPVLNRFVKQNDATVYRARFYRQAMEAKDKLELYNEYRKDGDMAKAREFSRWVSVGRTGNKLWKQMNALRDQELKAKDRLTGAALDARLRELDEKQVALSNRFFEIYKKAAAPKSAPSR